MMSTEQHILLKLMEECSEVAQIASKSMLFGFDDSHPKHDNQKNIDLLHGELDDLLGIVEMLNDKCGFGYMPNPTNLVLKQEKVMNYMQYSRECGRTK